MGSGGWKSLTEGAAVKEGNAGEDGTGGAAETDVLEELARDEDDEPARFV